MIWRTPGGPRFPFYEDVLRQTHVLIAGAPGSGKSVVLNGLIYTALYKAPCDAAFILCDPKRVELARYAGLPHVLRLAKDTAEIDEALKVAHEIMMNRYCQMERAGQVETDLRDIYVIVDELSDLITKGANKEINKLKASIESSIESIGKLGRAAHVHLILATQDPSRSVLKASITKNITSKIALRCDDAIDSRQIIGTKGAEHLPKNGDCLYKTPETCGIVHYTGIPLLPPDEIAARIQWWTSQKPTKTGFLRRLFKKSA